MHGTDVVRLIRATSDQYKLKDGRSGMASCLNDDDEPYPDLPKTRLRRGGLALPLRVFRHKCARIDFPGRDEHPGFGRVGAWLCRRV